ncbi:Hsp33 family molecular chaperone HslO [Gorillibacterium timonense]|uniref:Hsp33 family molecular chaperone HslO n=1 Tax=Gorillibacterium timonense TaxID=1689269 RepID=UPI00071C34DC|nr:Hsp33 family molecular chaperone HslO [Gorillibacterium timonense]
MKDELIRATAKDGKFRAFAVHTTALTEELRRRHSTTPTATAALGRTLAAGAMIGAMMKGEEKLTIQIKGGGPIGQIVVDANAKGEVRGYVDNPAVDLPLNEKGKLDVSGAVGTDGFIYIIRDLGMKEPYLGSTPIVSGELAEDFTYYFAKSEQTPSVVALGVLVDKDYTVKAAGGFIVQLLPGVSEDEIAQLEEKLSKITSVTSLLESGATLEDILASILEDVRILDRMDVSFRCKCSRERVERTLISLGREELTSILEEDGKIDLVCHFCNETYHFTDKEIEGVITKIDS